MKARYALLVVLGISLVPRAYAQRSCPALVDVVVANITATSATLQVTPAVSGIAAGAQAFYSYGGGALLSVRTTTNTLTLANLPPATLITVNVYAKCGQVVPEDMTTSSGAITRTFTTAAVLATRGTAALVALELSPNPAHTTATLRLPVVPLVTQATLHLTDALGRLVRTESALLGKPYELSIAGLPGGVYFVQVQAGEAWAVRRLVVQ